MCRNSLLWLTEGPRPWPLPRSTVENSSSLLQHNRGDQAIMNDSLVEYFRCPDDYVRLEPIGPLWNINGYFRFAKNLICYGRCAGIRTSASPLDILDKHCEATVKAGTAFLPFDPDEVIGSLRQEMFMSCEGGQATRKSALTGLYYLLRPFLPVAVRKHLQKLRLSGWRDIPFPHWPVDTTVDALCEELLLLCLKAGGLDSIPFIWFWPEGASSCVIVTHDVETNIGLRSCSYLMDVADEFGIKTSFQLIPEERYNVTAGVLDRFRKRGFEIAVHDLNHDGRLFGDKDEFLRRAKKINAYKQRFGATGFRSGALYRKQSWFEALDFSYDMSVPNVAHLDPQRGGCCTVMPYFIGKILELPVTATQDYTLFNILNNHSIDLWKQQIKLIMEKHGLISFIVHPDYVSGFRERTVYESLLGHLADVKSKNGIWITPPGEVDRWWRQRAKMKLVKDGAGWRIEGSGSERARIAYASEKDGQIRYECSLTSNDISFADAKT